MRHRFAFAWGTVALLAACAGDALGQYAIDRAVSMQRPAATGGAVLDRNPQVGASGLNYARPMSPLMVGNLAAQGNLGRGLSLRVETIPDATEFRGSLGSAALSGFRRDSVSAQASPLGQAPFVRPYYDPAQTVPLVGTLRGLPNFGTAPRGSPARPVPELPDLRLSSQVPSVLPGLTGPLAPSDVAVKPPWYRDSATTSSSLFGIQPTPRLPLPQQTEHPWDRMVEPERVPPESFLGDQVLERRTQPDRPEGTERKEFRIDEALRQDLYPQLGLITPGTDAKGSTLGRRPGEGRTGTGKDLRGLDRQPAIGHITPGAADKERLGLPTPPLPRGPDRVGVQPPALGVPGAVASPRSRPPRPLDPTVLPGFDVLTDMKLALVLAANPGAPWFEEMQRAVQDDPQIAGQLSQQVARNSAEFVDRALRVPLKSLSGSGASYANEQLLKAEALMDIGHYREAADRYEAARQAEPMNPLPLLGKAHALLAGGEYRSAISALFRSIELADYTPGLAAALFQRLDLTDLIGGGEIVDIRRADLMRQLERSENAELRFLLGYVEYYTGQPERGLENLRKAADNPLGHAVMSRFPRILQRPPPIPSVPPAVLPTTLPAPVAPGVLPEAARQAQDAAQPAGGRQE